MVDYVQWNLINSPFVPARECIAQDSTGKATLVVITRKGGRKRATSLRCQTFSRGQLMRIKRIICSMQPTLGCCHRVMQSLSKVSSLSSLSNSCRWSKLPGWLEHIFCVRCGDLLMLVSNFAFPYVFKLNRFKAFYSIDPSIPSQLSQF